jgi:hypothetical protein
MKSNLLNKIKGAILSTDEAKTISGGYDVSPCFRPCCPPDTSFTNPVYNANGCTDSRPIYTSASVSGFYCVKC